MHELLVRRPLEDREAPVLRGNERRGVALIVDELRRRKMSRAAELRRRGADRALPSTGSVS